MLPAFLLAITSHPEASILRAKGVGNCFPKIQTRWELLTSPPHHQLTWSGHYAYHPPQKHFLPEKIYLNYFLITITRFEIFRINFRNYPILIARVCEFCDITRLGSLSLLNVFITVARFEVFRVNWVMFSWRMV